MASTGDTWRLGHRPQLDGIRGLAIVLVVLCHTFQLEGAGPVGVSMFFALSGFLITTLMLEEQAASGRISLRGFYLRRARRLFPALLCMVAVSLTAGLLISPAFGTPNRALAALFYVGNWHRPDAIEGFGHTWSLGVEEQFYLTYPLLVVFLLRSGRGRRALAVVTAAVMLVSVALRVVEWNHGAGADRIYYGTATAAVGILMGALLALRMHGRPASASTGRYGWWPLGIALLLAIVPGAFFARLVDPVLAPLLTVVSIWLVVRGPYVGPLAGRGLTHVGRRSYGLYLWHWPIVGVPSHILAPSIWVRLALLGAACVMTLLSWRYVESPFLRRGRLTSGGGRSPLPCSLGYRAAACAEIRAAESAVP